MPTLQQLMEAGVHFGHKKARSFPKSKVFTFGIREGIYIIDLEKTKQKLDEAAIYLKSAATNGKTIMFVGTKYQARGFVESAAKELNMPYVTERWFGGTLTNFETINENIKKMKKLESDKETAKYKALKKKEKLRIEEKIQKLHNNLDGVAMLKKVPDILFVVDTVSEKNAVHEAITMNIPVVGICDTNADPTIIDFPIPANDDAKKSLEMVIGIVKDSIAEGLKNKPVIN
ncbi:MAG: 30S ribosomal protein S2 [Patescibacteria group bacterium]